MAHEQTEADEPTDAQVRAVSERTAAERRAHFQPVSPRWLRPTRDRVRGVPGGETAWKALIAVLGAVVVAFGIVLIPLPGPGWAVVFVGLAIWATEFHWAHRTLRHARGMVSRWTGWVKRQSAWVRGLLAVAGVLFVGLVAYLAIEYAT